MKLKLPEYVEVCRLCKGRGQYEQAYCDVPIRMTGPCDLCYQKDGMMCGTGLVYTATGKPAPISVLAQVALMNEGASLPFALLGPPWRVLER
jgi:hypothetical protein